MRAVFSIPTLAGALAGASLAVCAQPAPAPAAAAPAPIPYATVQEALKALSARDGVDGVIVTHPDGWVLVTDSYGSVQWSFTPKEHAAYPALVRRSIRRDAQGEPKIEFTALCEAPKAACDQLTAEFEESSDRMRQSMRARSRLGSSQQMQQLMHPDSPPPPASPTTQPPPVK